MNKEVLQYYDETNDIFGFPQIYKGLEIYPLKLIDLKYMKLFYQLFAYPQIAISAQSPMVFKMSYLKFLIYILQYIYDEDKSEISFEDNLILFLEHVTKKEVTLEKANESEENIANVVLLLRIGGKTYTESDFTNIREIILEQNGLSIEYVEDFKPTLEKDLEYFNRKNQELNVKDQIFSFAAQFQKLISEVSNCTFYQMKNLTDSMSGIYEFKMQTIPITSVTEDYEFKSYFKHLKKTGRYDNIIEDTENFKSKASFLKSDEELVK